MAIPETLFDEAFELKPVLTALSQADPKLAAVMVEAEPFTVIPSNHDSIFSALARSIAYQQLAGKAARAIHTRFVELLEAHGELTPQTALSLTEAQLRSVGLSRSKTLAIHDLAAKVVDGTVPDFAACASLSNQELITRITSVRGIGPWTVEMMLMSDLGRPDVLPVSDYGVRKGFQLTYGLDDLPKPKAMRERAECWQPYRSIGSWYMWRAVDLVKQVSQQAS